LLPCIADLALAQVSGVVTDADLEASGPRSSGRAGDAHPVFPLLAQAHRAEIGDDVGREVAPRIAHLVEELLLDGAEVDPASGPADLAEHRAAVSLDVRMREPQGSEAGDVLPAGIGEVPAAELPRALEEVPDDGTSRDAVAVVETPLEVMNERRDEQRWVGDAPGDDDLGAARKRREERVRSQIGVRRDHGSVVAKAAAGLERRLVQIQRAEDVVPNDRGDSQGQLQPSGDLHDPPRGGERIRGAHVRQQPDSVPFDRGQEQLQAPLQQQIISSFGIVTPAQLRQRDGALREAFKHEVVHSALLGEQHRRLQAIAREAGARADPHRLIH
jgi:hypothetical protein